MSAAISVRNVTKSFPGALALSDVSFDVEHGQIHALLGENGAGKSTLIKILSGIHRPDAGGLQVNGTDVALSTPLDARAAGISTVPQEVLFVPELSVGRNILLGLEGRAARRASLTRAEREVVADALRRIGADFDESTRAGSLSVPQIRLAQVARTFIHTGHVVVLDEPTAALSESDAEALLRRLLRFREQGKAIVYVTHRLSEVIQIADRVTVLRDGRRVGTFTRSELDTDRIIALMAKDGETSKSNAAPGSRHTPRPEARSAMLAVTSLSAAGRFEEVSLVIPEGQLVGIAGVQGSGHGYLLRAIAGIDGVDSGSVEINGAPVRAGVLSEAFARGALLVPADRRRAGIVPTLSIRANVALTGRVRAGCRRFGIRWRRQERAMAKEYVDALSIRAPGVEAQVGTLSGGNQQKVAIARSLEGRPSVLLVEEPTQGIDVHAKREIRTLIERAARREGSCAVIASSEFEELVGFVDVIHVMCQGRAVAELPGATATYGAILKHALP